MILLCHKLNETQFQKIFELKDMSFHIGEKFLVFFWVLIPICLLTQCAHLVSTIDFMNHVNTFKLIQPKMFDLFSPKFFCLDLLAPQISSPNIRQRLCSWLRPRIGPSSLVAMSFVEALITYQLCMFFMLLDRESKIDFLWLGAFNAQLLLNSCMVDFK